MLFDRVYRLLIGKKGRTSGIEITDLRITFSIQKTAKKNPNSGTISVWNLRKSTRQEIERPDTRCLLYAGYREDAGPILIFQGNVMYAYTKFDGPDIVTEMELGDGHQELRDTTISVGYGKGVRSKQILGDVAAKMQMPLTMPSNAPERTWQNGLSFYGAGRTLLDKVVNATNLEWSVQNGVLQVLEKGMVTTRQGLEISSSSGMIGSPEAEREDKDETGGSSKKKKGTNIEEPKAQWNGWNVPTLLLPMLNPGDRVLLNARAVQGVFRIEDLTHTGDSHGGDWQTELKLVDPAKPIGDKAETKGGSAPQRAGPTNQAKKIDSQQVRFTS